MSQIAVNVEGISKIYRLGVKERSSDNIAGMIWDFVRSPLNNFRKYRSLYRFDEAELQGLEAENGQMDDILWALKNVSFSVDEGEVVGIIGGNGAGKSTLLKILSRITPPTRGEVTIRGRVSSLLEVGTGFHPELTGRENVYLNGTILGMRKREVDERFDEIVAFSEVEKFLDTPVKRYSSGMRVRLAFAVAAHLEPEILIVDEVLAVGDAAFQQKCMNKMQDVGKEGRTVLFVSHNMPAVTSLCDRVIWLDQGRKVSEGPAREIVGDYLLAGSTTTACRQWNDADSAPAGRFARLLATRVITEKGDIAEHFDIQQPVGIQMEYEVLEGGEVMLPHFRVKNEDGVLVFVTLDHDPEWYQRPRPAGFYTSTVWIPGNFLNEGPYFVDCALITRHPDIPQFNELAVLSFAIAGSMEPGTARGDWPGRLKGVVSPVLEWKTDYRKG